MLLLLFNPKNGDIVEVSPNGADRFLKEGYKVIARNNRRFITGWLKYSYYCRKCKEWHIVYEDYDKYYEDHELGEFFKFLKRIKPRSCDEVKEYEKYMCAIARFNINNREEFEQLKKLGELYKYVPEDGLGKIIVDEDTEEVTRLIETYKKRTKMDTIDVIFLIEDLILKNKKIKVSELRKTFKEMLIETW